MTHALLGFGERRGRGEGVPRVTQIVKSHVLEPGLVQCPHPGAPEFRLLEQCCV